MGATNCPETPRQKMIGMMYLVLTALLALNVSKDLLNAFVIVDKGLIKTNENIAINNANLHGEFSKQYTLNKDKVQKFYDKSIKAKQYTAELLALLKDIKREVIATTEFGDGHLKETTYEEDDANGKSVEKKCKVEDLPIDKINAKDNYDVPMRVLIGHTEEGTNGRGMELKKKIDEYKNKMFSLFDDIDPKIKKTLNIGLNTEEEYNVVEGKKCNWAFNSFYHTILAADIILLDKLSAEIMNAETRVVTTLGEAIDKKNFKFDQVGAKVIASSNYVIQGDKFKADIIVAAYSSTEKPLAYIRAGADTLPASQIGSAQQISDVSNGVVKYEVGAGTLGDQKFAGVIRLRKPGTDDFENYYFKSSYTVAKPTAIVAATKMNVFYIGVDNPVEVSVPGVPDTKVFPSTTGGCSITKAAHGYIVKCPSGTTNTSINVTAEFSGRKQSMGASPFRVKPVPNPVPSIGGVESGPIRKEILLASPIIPQMKGFDFDLQFVVTGFTMGVNVGGDYIERKSSSNQLTPEMKRLVQALNRGQRIFLDEINAIGPDRTTRKLNQVILKLL